MKSKGELTTKPLTPNFEMKIKVYKKKDKKEDE